MTDVPRLHVIVPDPVAGRAGFAGEARELLRRAGPSLALHLRTRSLAGRRLHELASELSRAADDAGGWCLVNGRVDVALTAGARGVQLGRGALPVPEARWVLGEGAAVGASVHGREESRRAAEEGATFLLLGTIFSTPSHPERAPAGLERIRACRGVGPPLIAIGGMTPDRVPEVAGTGAHGVATLSGVWGSDAPAGAVDRFLEALSEVAWRSS